MKTNLLLLSLVLLCMSCGSKENTIKLFNGENLDNWEFIVQGNSVPASEVYSVKNGVIHIKGAPLGYMYTKEKYADFKLHVEWRWPEEASNSGIFTLIEEPNNPFPNGIECQLAAGSAGDLVLLGGSNLKEFTVPEGQERPAFPVIKKKKPSNEKPVGEWNEADITVKNGVLTIVINGEEQNKGTNTVTSGHIGLQSEGKAVEFRNVTLTTL